ncbi:TPA: DNA-binding protein [Pseudomonas aeruginosa]|uniref:helix-turn-helix domain-containing transcriptional regulator n=1 Tax=Pseudomonas aeruginosa TaxID=287 RepID=UPI000F533178|nr:hypothetical protein [Pseudomonas aeruginosa]MBA5357141.1 hypothetical protein [Pseudomonas aeruginosa]MBG5722128.1 hypothetical protein [Pseudomonas aeruginosa]MBG7431898.1 hypothetical protein [Pseudomonas aeruginosa]MBX5522891.1 hypothetical protein [Pseudomonas aeruginosa]MBX5688244.1 hypothetical protein [Pseudomonas aeruginosa]
MMLHDDEMQPGRGLQTFDVAAHLKDEETIRAYLQAALDDPTPEALWLALGNVAEALERISANKQVRD